MSDEGDLRIYIEESSSHSTWDTVAQTREQLGS